MEGKKYYKNYSYLIEQDKFTENPDQWSDDLFLVYDHRNFCIERDGFYPTEIKNYSDLKTSDLSEMPLLLNASI